jgi:uncharacterized membrane protein YhaH (DUF805 family)
MNVVDLRTLFTSPQGRIGRAAFWLGMLILLCVEAMLRLTLGVPFTPTPSDPFLVRLLSFLIDVVLLYPEVVIVVKRLHDRNRPGDLVGWLIIPLSVLLITNLLGMSGDPEHMGLVETLLVIATSVIALAFLIDLGFRRGSDGANQYGPDTLRARS